MLLTCAPYKTVSSVYVSLKMHNSGGTTRYATGYGHIDRDYYGIGSDLDLTTPLYLRAYAGVDVYANIACLASETSAIIAACNTIHTNTLDIGSGWYSSYFSLNGVSRRFKVAYTYTTKPGDTSATSYFITSLV